MGQPYILHRAGELIRWLSMKNLMGLHGVLEGDALQASIERARTGVANLSRVTLASSHRGHLRAAVEEADWLGDVDRAEQLQDELTHLEDQIAKGYLYEPEF
jgi:hypothetical protein